MMALPAKRLRQPKCIQNQATASKTSILVSHLILTLKNEKKLVVPSDAYHGIVRAAGMCECVLCDQPMESDVEIKQIHVRSQRHRDAMINAPFCEDFSENLIRKLPKNRAFCSICSTVTSEALIIGHIHSESHISELNKALARSHIYKPQ